MKDTAEFPCQFAENLIFGLQIPLLMYLRDSS
jgi:hypothetical protein